MVRVAHGIVAKIQAFAISAALFTLLVSIAHGQSIDEQAKALNLITETADRICNVVSDKGTANSSEVKGDINVQLSRLASLLAAAGITGTASITNEAYQGPLRQDLAKVLNDNATCKLQVFISLQNKLILQAPSATPKIFKTVVCTGEYESNCPGPHHLFYTCGYFGSDNEIATKVCAKGPQKVLRLKTVSGHKCGYALIEVTCD